MIQRVDSVQQFLAKEKAAFKNLEQNTKIDKQAKSEKVDAKKGESIAKKHVLGSAWYMFEMALAMRDEAISGIQEGDASKVEVASDQLGKTSKEQKQIGQMGKTLADAAKKEGLSGQQMTEGLMKEQMEMAHASSKAFLAEQNIQTGSFQVNTLGSQQNMISGMASHVNNLELQMATFLRFRKY